MATWNGATPPVLPPPSRPERLRGSIRLAVWGAATGSALALFLLGRALRRWFGRWIGFHFAVERLWARVGVRLLGLRLGCEGRPITTGMLVANHCSWADILVLKATGHPYFVAKADVERWPGVGYLARVAGTLFIERKRTEAKRHERQIRERIQAGQLLALFPEGTSSDGLRVLPFKSSLFAALFDETGRGAALAVQPVTIAYERAPGARLPPTFYGWWGSMGFEAHVWSLLCRSRGARVRVVYHPPVYPADFADRKALAAACETAVRSRIEA